MSANLCMGQKTWIKFLADNRIEERWEVVDDGFQLPPHDFTCKLFLRDTHGTDIQGTWKDSKTGMDYVCTFHALDLAPHGDDEEGECFLINPANQSRMRNYMLAEFAQTSAQIISFGAVHLPLPLPKPRLLGMDF